MDKEAPATPQVEDHSNFSATMSDKGADDIRSCMIYYRRICLNRWLTSLAYGFIGLTCCAIYYGWQQFQKMLFRGGAYEWVCTPEELEKKYRQEVAACREQNGQVQILYVLASSMEFIVGVVAGVVLDHLGPRSCGLCGMIMLLVGILLLVFSSQSFQAYIPAMMLIGGSVNLIGFPTLLIGDLFPGRQSFAIACVSATQVGCTVIAVIMLEIWRALPEATIRSIFFGYLLTVWVLDFVLCALFMPVKRSMPLSDEPRTESTVVSTPPADYSVVEMQPPETEEQNDGPAKHLVKQATDEPQSADANTSTGNWQSFFLELRTWEVLVFTLYYVFQLSQFTYYPVTPQEMFGPKISDFVGCIMPTQILFGLGLGWFANRWGTLPICYVMNTLNALTFTFMLIGNYSLQYATAVIHCIAISFFFTSKYTYVTEIYPPNNFGKLAGFIGFCGGMFVFVNIPISASHDYTLWSSIFLGVSGLCYLALMFLSIRKMRGIDYLKIPSTEMPRRN